MTLYDIAKLFTEQLLDKFYLIKTDSRQILVKTFPKHFLHLTGMQRCIDIKIKSSEKFFYDCIHNKYSKQLKEYNYKNKSDKNMVDMKTRNFARIEESIKNAELLYILDNDNTANAVSVAFKAGKSDKYMTIVFKLEKGKDYFIPASIQIDKSYEYSIIKTATRSEKITSVECIHNK